MRDLQVLQYRVHPFDRAKRGEKRSSNRCPQLGRKLLGDRASQRFVMLEDRRHTSSKEQIECLIQTEADAMSCQHLRKAAATQHLAIDQHTVAIENNEIGFDHRNFPRSQSEHILKDWAITLRVHVTCAFQSRDNGWLSHPS